MMKKIFGFGVLGFLCVSAFAGNVQVKVLGSTPGSNADAVVMVYDEAGEFEKVQPQLGQVIQKDKAFMPRVLAVAVGSPVSFPNQDTVRHHVYSFSSTKKFELKLYIGQPLEPIMFDKAGIVAVGCNIHDQMAAWIVVSDTKWFEKTNEKGEANFVLKEGKYKVKVFHPDLPSSTPLVEKSILVKKEDQRVELTVAKGQ